MRLPIPFDNPRTYPGHSGVDFPQSRGTAILASGPGVVSRVWKNSKGGWWTTITYDNPRVRVGYAHQDKKPVVKVGQRVNLGSVIGQVGSLGLNSTGPHLHMEISYEPGYEKVWKYFDKSRTVGKSTPPAPPLPETIGEDDMALFILERSNSQLSKCIYDPVTGRAGRTISVSENTAYRRGQSAGAVVYVTVSDGEYRNRGGK